MLKIAKKSYQKLNLIQADAEHLPFRADTFEMISIFTVIQNLLELDKLIKEIDRVSREHFDLYVSILKKDKLLSNFQDFINKNPNKIIEKINIDEIEDLLYYIKRKKENF